MCQTSHLGHTGGHQRFVPTEVIAHQAALPSPQEDSGDLACAALAEVIDHRPGSLEGARGIGPEVGSVCLAISSAYSTLCVSLSALIDQRLHVFSVVCILHLRLGQILWVVS